MITALKNSALLCAFGALSLSPAYAEDEAAADISRGEAELAELLKNRVAGEPIRCLRPSQSRGLRIIDETAMVFRDGRTVYINRTNAPRFLDEFDLPVFRQFTSRLCDNDQVEMRDRGSNGSFGGPILLLEEFTPYTVIETDSESTAAADS